MGAASWGGTKSGREVLVSSTAMISRRRTTLPRAHGSVLKLYRHQCVQMRVSEMCSLTSSAILGYHVPTRIYHILFPEPSISTKDSSAKTRVRSNEGPILYGLVRGLCSTLPTFSQGEQAVCLKLSEHRMDVTRWPHRRVQRPIGVRRSWS